MNGSRIFASVIAGLLGAALTAILMVVFVFLVRTIGAEGVKVVVLAFFVFAGMAWLLDSLTTPRVEEDENDG